MRERLGKIPQEPLRSRVVFLGEETEVVREPGETVEELDGLLVPAEQLVAVREPERARQEDTFAGRQPVDAALAAVAEDEAVLEKLALDRLDRAADTGIRGGEEADERQHQEARVEFLRPVRLDERA